MQLPPASWLPLYRHKVELYVLGYLLLGRNLWDLEHLLPRSRLWDLGSVELVSRLWAQGSLVPRVLLRESEFSDPVLVLNLLVLYLSSRHLEQLMNPLILFRPVLLLLLLLFPFPSSPCCC